MTQPRTADGTVVGTHPARESARRPIGILFVCHGNICRSAMAQCVMQKLVDDRGLANRFRMVTAADGDAWDYLVYMDAENERDLARILGPETTARVCRLMSFTMRCDDVADPWYTGDFGATYADVLEGCSALLDLLS